jgi:uroporphyrinogen decarboxylase
MRLPMPLANTTFLDACHGRTPAHSPVWVMRQAGRYLPEYRAIRAKVSFEELCRTPELCAEVTLQPIDRFGLDAAILFSDILVVFDALGAEVAFNPAPVVASPVRSAEAFAALQGVPVAESLHYVFDAVRACKAALSDRVPLIGFCGAPFTTASYLVEGGGSKEFMHIKRMAFAEPELFDRVLTRITDVLIEYLAGQVAAGVDALQIFESWGAALSPEDYRRYALPHLSRLCAAARSHGVPVIAFVRGNASLLEQARELPADVLGIDWSIEMSRALDVVGRDRVVQGNLDPMLLFAPPEAITARTHAVLEAGSTARGHVFNLGHGISQHTDPAMMKHLVDVVHAWGR